MLIRELPLLGKRSTRCSVGWLRSSIHTKSDLASSDFESTWFLYAQPGLQMSDSFVNGRCGYQNLSHMHSFVLCRSLRELITSVWLILGGWIGDHTLPRLLDLLGPMTANLHETTRKLLMLNYIPYLDEMRSSSSLKSSVDLPEWTEGTYFIKIQQQKTLVLHTSIWPLSHFLLDLKMIASFLDDLDVRQHPCDPCCVEYIWCWRFWLNSQRRSVGLINITTPSLAPEMYGWSSPDLRVWLSGRFRVNILLEKDPISCTRTWPIGHAVSVFFLSETRSDPQ